MTIRLGIRLIRICFLVPLFCPAVHRKIIISFWGRCTTVIFLFMYLLSGKTVNQSQTHKIHILNNCWGVEGCLYVMKLFETVIWEITATTGHSLVIPSRLVFGNFKIIFSLFCVNVFFSILFSILWQIFESSKIKGNTSS